MTPEKRKAALRKLGITQKMIAEKLGVSEMSVSRQVNNRDNYSVSDRIMTAIAEAIGRPKERVFPEYYLGAPKRSTSKVAGKNNRYKRGSQCLSRHKKLTACS